MRDYKIICGVDEVGRGPLAGPVYSAAVIFDFKEIEGVNDSKKLSPKKRESLFEKIIENNVTFGVGEASVQEIENLNILNASHLSMVRAVKNLNVVPDLILVDGNSAPNFSCGSEVRTIVKGDSISYVIACASIIAKVSRDKFMCDVSEKFPFYEFEKNKGYGTKSHIDSIKKFGPCEIHRMSFLRKIL